MSFAVPFAEGSIILRTDRVSASDAERQERTAREILRRLHDQPGLVLADEVGMGKTFVALAVGASIALARPDDGPVVVMVPPSLKQKWPRDWTVFKGYCLRGDARQKLEAASAETGVAFMKWLDDPPERRKSIIFLTHGALNRSLTDEWVKLALIRRALLRRATMKHVRRAIPRFAGRLLRSQWVDRRAPWVWEDLLDRPPDQWRRVLRSAGLDEAARDEPVPAALIDAMEGLDFGPVLEALERVPLRESAHVDARLQEARQALSDVLAELWKEWLKQTHFHSPLLIFDEAHHLKNVTRLTSLFVEEEAREDSESVSRGPLFGVFGRMLFLTATPFQLGHHELVNVIRRFEGITWDSDSAPPVGKAGFTQAVEDLQRQLNEAQMAALRLDRAWGRIGPHHVGADRDEHVNVEEWWRRVQRMPPDEGLASDVLLRYRECHEAMRAAEESLRPWVIRHLKPRYLPPGPEPEPRSRRNLLIGASILHDLPQPGERGLEVEGEALLPFLMAARAQVVVSSKIASGYRTGGRALFAEGLASSYEAYLETRKGNVLLDDEDGDPAPAGAEDPETAWYLGHLDSVLPEQAEEIRARHPKVFATVNRVIHLWWQGEKSLIFCYYRATGRALRRYVSRRLEQELLARAAATLRVDGPEDARLELERLSDRFFDTDRRLRVRAEGLLRDVTSVYTNVTTDSRERMVEIALRFLRTPSFLVRFYPLGADDPVQALEAAFDQADGSGLTLRQRIERFCGFLANRCVHEEREEYLAALSLIQTGFRRQSGDLADASDDVTYLPNVRLANGEVKDEIRRRLLLAFNTPFFPEILIASSVLAEGVDLHLDCRFVVHHDLSWNPSSIEQRTGRVDRIGCKAEQARRPIHVYLPFVTATQDEKMYRVVRDRERWFSVVMGERYQLDERSTDRLAERVPFPEEAARALAFDLSVPTS
jgi:hypothetical protein